MIGARPALAAKRAARFHRPQLLHAGGDPEQRLEPARAPGPCLSSSPITPTRARSARIGWEVYPRGLHRGGRGASRAFGLPLLITENGIATDDENLREAIPRSSIWSSWRRALAQAVDVIGYLYWSLMDNFEWDHGAAPHFGLAAVDATTQERRIRPAAEWLARICRDNRVVAAPIAGAEDGVRDQLKPS